MRVPPVLMLFGALGLSVGFAGIDPLAKSSLGLRVLGAMIAVAGLATALAGVLAFRQQRTTVDPRYPERASALVADGIYRWTRNPMYVGFVCVAIGAAIALGSLFAAGTLRSELSALCTFRATVGRAAELAIGFFGVKPKHARRAHFDDVVFSLSGLARRRPPNLR
jgi:protein-S-isoprenylcysteine O-methyltransferase Ste14